MRFIKIRLWLALYVLIVVLSNCAPTLPPLTAQQLRIEIVNGNQETTLALSETHVPAGSAVVSSEYDARVRADQVEANVAQLMYSNHSKQEYTYRFWKLK